MAEFRSMIGSKHTSTTHLFSYSCCRAVLLDNAVGFIYSAVCVGGFMYVHAAILQEQRNRKKLGAKAASLLAKGFLALLCFARNTDRHTHYYYYYT